MRLINATTLRLEEFLDYEAPCYAILSHTWGEDREELSFRDMQEGIIDRYSLGSIKLHGTCRQAEKDGLGYVWIDTCCIDKTNLVELSEAINSMFRWYKRASVCYAYLSDVPSNDVPRSHGSRFRTSRWFRRGWTLQELLAPKNLRFYDSEWQNLGTKGSMWAIVNEITGIPRNFLLGIAELHAAGVAQRMSWAAQRDTKRREDLAYCLLGIFDVTMPMIYGEGGNQAFFRLQEQIMKISRDDSILAWGLGAQDPTPIDSNSGQVRTERILAAAPSDFANSGHIVPREQSTTFLNPLDIYGGSLRIHLSLLTTPDSEVFGLLRCGPEYDTEQVVAIPLAKVSSGSSDEYVRLRGCHSMLQPATAPSTLPRLVHIKNDIQSEQSVDTDQEYWLYDDAEFAGINLKLVDVVPRSYWQEERAMIVSEMGSSHNDSHQTLLRLRHNGNESQDFVVVLGVTQQGTRIEAQCCVMICSRDTSLGEVARKLEYMMPKTYGKRSASNGPIHLNMRLESNVTQPIFTIKPERLLHRPNTTINATGELQEINLKLALTQVLEESGHQNSEKKILEEATEDKTNQLEQARREREIVEDEIRKLQQKRESLLEEEDNRAKEIFSLKKEQSKVMEKQRRVSEQWTHVWQRWHEFWKKEDIHGSKRIHESTLLRWAASNGYVEIAELLLNEGADVADANEDGWTPLICAAANDRQAVVQLLLDTEDVNVNSRDSNGRTPLSWAAEFGHETVVELLLQKGANVEARDATFHTPLSYAAKEGHEGVAQLLLRGWNWTLRHSLNRHDEHIDITNIAKPILSVQENALIWNAATEALQRRRKLAA
ncbi:hypothetical protein F5X98DRAFT_353603 [Xylaria grammica]|nr:hypothetical protein F5X98DRAFT_353603 [Xylaria grammica]